MSAGIGTALYTTLAGLICASLLGAQYMVLGRGVERLVAELAVINEQGGKLAAPK